MHRQRKTRNELICRIDMTAFLSIQLVLLFLFMNSIGSRPDLPRNSVDLASVAHPVLMPGADKEDAIVVAVQRDGSVYLGLYKLSLEQLPDQIREAVNEGSERKVYIKADMRARYGAVLQVLAAVRSAGIENIGFLVDQRQSPLQHRGLSGHD
jgi:biopolymer transport protein TolR